MPSIIKAGNATDGVQVSSDNTGTLDLRTGTGAGTTAIGIDASQNVTLAANLVVTGTATIGGQPAGGNYALNAYTSPATWSKPAGLKAVKVTVVGQGGAGGATTISTNGGGGGGGGGTAIDYIPAPSIPGPVAVTAGPGTNSFGAFCSATAGGAGVGGTVQNAGGSGGVGSGGQVNIGGGGGAAGGTYLVPAAPTPNATGLSGAGGASSLGGGGAARGSAGVGNPGRDFGGGGSGAIAGPANAGGTGAPGVVIVEEFY
jgi:hypothetical protein